MIFKNNRVKEVVLEEIEKSQLDEVMEFVSHSRCDEAIKNHLHWYDEGTLFITSELIHLENADRTREMSIRRSRVTATDGYTIEPENFIKMADDIKHGYDIVLYQVNHVEV